ncbi:31113_t:CDS:2, partial [Racocetra persica]
MDYKVPTHAEIDPYFSVNPISEWQHFNAFINFKLEDGRVYTAEELFRSFCRSLACIENGNYPKFVTDYAKNLKTATKMKRNFFMELAEKIIERIERRQLMKENEIDIQEKQSLRVQVSKSKALDDITNAIIGKRKRDSNDDYDNEHINIETFDNEQTARENYAISARELSNDLAMSSFNIKASSKQVFTWEHVIPKMEINENSTKDVCPQMFGTDEHAYCDFTKSPP